MSATLVKDATLTGGTAQRRPENAHLLRDKLLARIEDDLETHRLVMLKAPPGYGKSVVMTQLEARLHEKGAAVRISLGLAHGAPA
ncbi:MAG: hypothetical protein KAH44_10750, partial [Oricola sp.]|nr:hypothetical protein [Oricola sp.]